MPDRCGDTLGISGNEDRVSSSDAIWAEIVPTGGSIPVISFLFNLIWLIFAGIWIALAELFFGLLLCITIIGIPFGLQHFKLMRLAIYPFGYDLR